MWEFVFQEGTIETRRVTVNVNRAPQKALPSLDVQMVLTGDEVKIVEESVTKLAATYTREVPDGDNIIEDQTVDDRNTVDVTPTGGGLDTMKAGTYVVTNWESEWRYNRAYLAVLTVVELETRDFGGFGRNFGRFFGR